MKDMVTLDLSKALQGAYICRTSMMVQNGDGDEREIEALIVDATFELPAPPETINLNDIVRFTLTEHGLKMRAEYRAGLQAAAPRLDFGFKESPDEEMHIWEMAFIYGKSMHMGATMPFTSAVLPLRKTS